MADDLKTFGCDVLLADPKAVADFDSYLEGLRIAHLPKQCFRGWKAVVFKIFVKVLGMKKDVTYLA